MKVVKSGSHYRLQQLQVLASSTNNATGFTTTSFPPPTFTGGGGSSTYDIVYSNTFNYQICGDFNGDGKGDVVVCLSNGNSYQTFFITPEPGATWTRLSPLPGDPNTIYTATFLAAIDIDGDGTHEILATPSSYSNSSRARVYKLLFDAPFPRLTYAYESEVGGFPSASHKLFTGDFNGDGKTDLLNRNGSTGSWNIAYGNSTGFYSIPFTQFNTYVELGYTGDVLAVADLNGDGKSDICHGRNNTSNSTLDIFYSRGSHCDFEERSYPNQSLLGWAPPLITDLNGDGRSEVINTTDIYSPLQILFFGRNGHERSISKISDGIGAKTEFQYGLMTETAVHARGTSFAYPTGDTQLPLELVKQISQSDGIGSMNSTNYSYGLAQLNRTGRGFTGFKKLVRTNLPSNRKWIDQFALEPNYAELYPASSETYRLDNPSTLLSNTVWNHSFVAVGAPALRRHEMRMINTIATDQLAGTTVSLTNGAWNTTGEVTATSTNVAGILTITTAITYIAAGPSTVACKPSATLVTTTRTGAPAQAVNTTFSYDATTGALTQKIDFQNKPVKNTTDYLYWPAGNLKKTTISYTGLPNNDRRIESLTYDPKFRFPTTAKQKWNNNGTLVDVTESFVYDARWGKVLEYTSTDQLVTNHVYDMYGREVSVSAPHLALWPLYDITKQYIWDINGNKVWYETTTDPITPTIKIWHDVLGREVETQTASFSNNTWTTSNINYDAVGRVANTTLPHLSTETPQVVTNTYDVLGRLETTQNSFSGTTTFGYSYGSGKLTTSTTTPANHTTSTTVDASGKTVSAHDDGGDLSYTYDSWGNLIQAKHGYLAQATNTYDVYGRKIKLIDLSGGITQYAYNAFNLLTWQKNANNQVTTFVYDNLGRLLSRTEPEGPSSWEYYYQQGKFNNNITIAFAPNNSISYEYDLIGNLVSTDQFVNGTGGMEKTFLYDDFSRLSSVIYDAGPMQVQLDYTYTATGYLDLVKQGATILFDGLNMNGFGKYKQYTLADGYTTSVTYNQQFPIAYTSPGVQHLELLWDPSTGNLDQRWDKQKHRRENFTYDALDRLTQSSVASVDDNGNAVLGPIFDLMNFTYDGSVGAATNGNLQKRSDIGKLGYSQLKITSAVGGNYPTNPYDPPLAISPNTQTVTYTSFHQPATISESVNGAAYTMTYKYGADHQRIYSELNAPSLGGYQRKRRYFGDLESTTAEDGINQVVLYVQGGEGLCAMLVASTAVGSTLKTYAVYKDHLGSLVTLTEKVGSLVNIVAEQNFDAWGRKRNMDWTYTNVPIAPEWLYRGYTGHEHVEPFALINMNGRMYDPLNGRMLSVDNFVQGGTQGFNRYSYALNNPLKYRDPSGEFIQFVIAGAIIGAYLGGAISAGSGGLQNADWNPFGGKNGAWTGDWWKGAITGAILGASAGYGLAHIIGGTSVQAALATKLGTAIGLSTKKVAITAALSLARSEKKGWDIWPTLAVAALTPFIADLSFITGNDALSATGFTEGVANAAYGFVDRYTNPEIRSTAGASRIGYGLIGAFEGAVSVPLFGGILTESDVAQEQISLFLHVTTALPGFNESLARGVISPLTLFGTIPFDSWYISQTNHYPRPFDLDKIILRILQ
jgi:RHS repeat-associated protein